MLNDDISIFTALENVLGLRPHGHGGTRKYLCPFHEDRRPSLVAYTRVNRCRCEAGCRINGREGADAIDVVRHGTECTMSEARALLNAAPVVPEYREEVKHDNRVRPDIAQRYAENLPQARSYYQSRGISNEYMKRWWLGCSPSYKPRADRFQFTHGPLAGIHMPYFPCRRFVIPTL